jgi:hypothetical protein
VVTEEQDTRIFQQPLPKFLAGERVLLIAVGHVVAGVGVDEVGRDDVRVESKKVTINIAQARILDSSLDEDKTRLYDWDRGLLIRGDYSLVEEARRDAWRTGSWMIGHAESNSDLSPRPSGCAPERSPGRSTARAPLPYRCVRLANPRVYEEGDRRGSNPRPPLEPQSESGGSPAFVRVHEPR